LWPPFLCRWHIATRRILRGGLTIWAGYLFLAVVAGSALFGELPLPILYAYLVLSTLTFIVYAVDKSAAQYGRWRTREATLHLLALAGGWPGALMAQKVLRHKSSKRSFRAVFWLTVLLNCSALIWLYTPDGRARLQRLTITGQDLVTTLLEKID